MSHKRSFTNTTREPDERFTNRVRNSCSESMSRNSDRISFRYIDDVSSSNFIGYARVSTLEQDPALQIDALESIGCRRIFVEHASGATAARTELTKAQEFLREGDTFVVWRLDRLGRSLRDLVEIVNWLDERGVMFKSITESIDTSTTGGRLVFHVFASLAEFERELIRERTLAGLESARARGRKGGRPTVMTKKKLAVAKTMIADLDENGRHVHTISDIASVLDVSRATLYRAIERDGRRGSGS